jgi:hypothetical protein
MGNSVFRRVQTGLSEQVCLGGRLSPEAADGDEPASARLADSEANSAEMPSTIHAAVRAARRLLQLVAAGIAPRHFPKSCCG